MGITGAARVRNDAGARYIAGEIGLAHTGKIQTSNARRQMFVLPHAHFLRARAWLTSHPSSFYIFWRRAEKKKRILSYTYSYLKKENAPAQIPSTFFVPKDMRCSSYEVSVPFV